MKTKRSDILNVLITVVITFLKTTHSANYNHIITQNTSSQESENTNLELENHHVESKNLNSELEIHHTEFENHENESKHDLESDNHNSEFDNRSQELVSMSTEKEAFEFYEPVIVKKYIKLDANSQSFPYTAALLRQTRYICTGALISKQWVLTNAEPFYGINEYYRDFRVRLGSEDYKKGGILIPVKHIEINQEFTGEKLGSGVALVQLAHDAELTTNILPIRIADSSKKEKAFPRGFILTFWAPKKIISEAKLRNQTNEDTWVRARKLQVKHLTLEKNSKCKKILSQNEIHLTNDIICLQDKKLRDCTRDQGAPVVVDAILWGIVTPWSPADCQTSSSNPILATKISEPTVSEWILNTIGAPIKNEDDEEN